MRILSIILIQLITSYVFSQEPTLGLIQKNNEEVFDGYTLLGNNEFTYLINNCGLIVNQWESNFRGGLGQYLLPNGNLLRAGKVESYFDAGGASGIIELFDWDGNLLWQYTIANEKQQLHHDLEPLPNGNFLCSIWERLDNKEAISLGRKYDHELWNERILEIEMIEINQAKIVWEWSAIDHTIQNHNEELNNYGNINKQEKLNINYLGSSTDLSNWLHINSIDYNHEYNQILISSRNFNELYVIDHSTSISEAKTDSGGRSDKGGDLLFRFGNPEAFGEPELYDQVLFGQHDAQWISTNSVLNNAFSLFNNEYIPFLSSQLLIVNNPIHEGGTYTPEVLQDVNDSLIIYEYTSENFYSKILSGLTILPNGNKLVTEGFTGRVFELNTFDKIVWEYIFPVNQNGASGIQGSQPKFNYLFKAQKYSPNLPIFSSVHIEPINPIELLPIINDCYLGSDEQTNTAIPSPLINMNITSSFLMIENISNYIIDYKLINSSGSVVISSSLPLGKNQIDLKKMASGFYTFLFELDANDIHVERIIIP